MAENTSQNVSKGGGKVPVSAMQAGRVAAAAKRVGLPEISPVAKLGINQARTAKRVCTLIVTHLQNGGSVSPEVLRACGQLAMVGSEMVAGA